MPGPSSNMPGCSDFLFLTRNQNREIFPKPGRFFLPFSTNAPRKPSNPPIVPGPIPGLSDPSTNTIFLLRRPPIELQDLSAKIKKKF